MKLNRLFGPAAVALLVFALASIALSQAPAYRISQPYSHKNLTIFLIHGKNETSKTNIITLPEALERRIFRVYETGDVNELTVENISKEFDVFIQSGDIVKGGKQDRVHDLARPGGYGRDLRPRGGVARGKAAIRRNARGLQERNRYAES